MPKKLDECVQSVLSDTPEMDESRAYAICNAELNAGVGEIQSLAETQFDAETLTEFATDRESWESHDGVWVDTESDLTIYDPDVVAEAVAGPTVEERLAAVEEQLAALADDSE